MNVLAIDSEYWAEARTHDLTPEMAIASIEKGLQIVRGLLPSLSDGLTIKVRPHILYVIPEYGTGGYTHNSENIEITFDQDVPYGLEATLESIYGTVFHEGNHAARFNAAPFDGSFTNSIVTEGLATVFERDHAKSKPIYGQYVDDATMRRWYEEVSSADWDEKRDELMLEHPDGRKWIGYKTGTWLVDRAIKLTGITVSDLTTLPSDEVIELAQL